LFAIDVTHVKEILSGGSVTLEDRLRVINCLYGWSKYGADVTEPIADAFKILTHLGLLPFSPSIGTVFALAKAIDTSYFLLRGKSFLPKIADLRRYVAVNQFGRNGVTPDEIVWNLWYAFDRLANSLRGFILYAVCRDDVLTLFNLIVDVQKLWFASDKGMLDALDSIRTKDKPSVRAILSGSYLRSTRNFKELREWLEQRRLEEEAQARAASSIPAGPPPPPPPPPPLAAPRRAGPEPYSNMSVVERKLAYGTGEEWPRCHQGWVCPGPTKHCAYVIPGQVPVDSGALDVFAVVFRFQKKYGERRATPGWRQVWRKKDILIGW